MPIQTLQPNDPQEMPLDALQNLIDALNAANEAWRRYAKAWGVPAQNYFEISENKEMQKAIFENESAYFIEGFRILLARVNPSGLTN
jgi:hypothetical protein